MTDEELLLIDEQRKWFLEMESTPGKNTVKIVEMTKKDLEYYINSVDRAFTGFYRIECNLKEVILWVKYYQTELHATEKLFVIGILNQCGKLHCCLILINYHSCPNPQPLPPWSASSHQQEETRKPGKCLWLSEGAGDGYLFL